MEKFKVYISGAPTFGPVGCMSDVGWDCALDAVHGPSPVQMGPGPDLAWYRTLYCGHSHHPDWVPWPVPQHFIRGPTSAGLGPSPSTPALTLSMPDGAPPP